MKKLIISACLLGEPCRYDGKSKPCDAVIALGERYQLLPVCPECMGGLPTPRPPSEIRGARVTNCEGRDVTANYCAGAEATLRLAMAEGCDTAILKEKSPSCGSGRIYDGSFSGTLTAGDGICAALLKAHGIRVLGESEIEELEKRGSE
ncbi:MAG: DUF523 domain-containing protein [Clostridia bacterium]|nr:DUF523 domain-containing protein [Clostridia bacterium]